MFDNYKDLIDSASCKCTIEFEEEQAVRAYTSDGEIRLPMLNMVYIPDKYLGSLFSKGFLEYSKLFKGIIEYSKCQNLPDVKGKEFYVWAFLHGYDYSHHGEPCYTGLLINADYLNEKKNDLIEEDSVFYKILKGIEDMDAPQCGPGPSDLNKKTPLEKKVVNLLKQ